MLGSERLTAIILSIVMLIAVMLSAVVRDMQGEERELSRIEVLQPHKTPPRGIEYESLEAMNNPKEFSIVQKLNEDTESTYSPFTYKYYFHNEALKGKTCAYGIDVSSRQGAVNWLLCRNDGVEFAFLRAGSRGYTEGGIFEDAMFDANAAAANTVGVRIGAYFYSQATNVEEIIEEANVIIRRVKGYDIDLPLVLDFEYADVEGRVGGRLYEANLSVEEATAMCLAFCDTIRAAGYEPAVYANSFMLNNRLDAERIAQECDIWIAYPDVTNPYEGEYTYWQYTWTGKIDGIKGSVDCNFWYK